jgi:5-(carboxyamino)imidazole ribonucleotide mutase
MKDAIDVLTEAGVSVTTKVVSAHRTPHAMVEFAQAAQAEGLSIIIAGAGGAAHLPGMVASLTPLPVIGVPIRLSTLEGMDSLLSIVQMPSGVPVATVGIGQARNAGILALRILALADSSVSDFVNRLMEEQTQRSLAKVLPPTVG